jgi:hypothetical protein
MIGNNLPVSVNNVKKYAVITLLARRWWGAITLCAAVVYAGDGEFLE